MTPFATLLAKGSITEALQHAAELDEGQLRLATAALNEERLQQIRQDVFGKLIKFHTKATLYIGGLLTLYRAASPAETAEGTEGAFADVLVKLDLSKTKAYDSMAIFRGFGRHLLADDNLQNRFSVEALKRLSASHVPPATRDAALLLARAGERVTVGRAEQLLRDHGLEARKSAPAKRVTKAHHSATLWSYRGAAVRLIVESDDPELTPGISVLHDLEAALAAFREQVFGDAPVADAHQPRELTHV